MEDLLVLIPALPLLAAAINLLLGRWFIKDRAHWIAIIGVAVAFVVSTAVFINQFGDDSSPLAQHLFDWIPAGQFFVPFNLYVDHLTAVMLMVVTTVSLLVLIYSVGYMHGDGGYYRFFSFMPLFVGAMLILVLADNFVVLFLGWEGVGVCSYLLIGYYFRRRSADDAAKKAFIVNRIGDFGFGVGILLIFFKLDTVIFAEVFQRIPTLSDNTVTLIALLLFAGAVGKSAQLPLHVWLPDAMEGPTPVSALIHAATMVTAGVYMVARMYPIFVTSGTAMDTVAIIGVLTAVVAGTIALTQYDIKRVIAYSTLSHLGFMIFALGVGAWVAAIFHLATHAFFKGLLFLGAGSVIHSLHEEQDIRNMGGLKKYMPITFWTFLIAALANAGIFPFAGYWSKDETIVGAWVDDQYIVLVLALIAAIFSSLYIFRLTFVTFLGEPRFDPDEVHPHESPWIMTIPMILLAIGAFALGGAIGIPPETGWIHDYLEPNFTVENGEAAVVAATNGAYLFAQEGTHEVETETTIIFATLSSIMALAGLGIMYLAYIRKSRIFDPTLWAAKTGPIYTLMFNKFYFDEIYEYVIVHPLYWFSNVVLWQVIDVRIIDGAVNGVARLTSWSAGQLRRVQTGFVANYALAIAIGAVIIIGAYFLFGSDLFT